LNSFSRTIAAFVTTTLVIASTAYGEIEEVLYWAKIRAKDKFERTEIVNLDVAIEGHTDEYVFVVAPLDVLRPLIDSGRVENYFEDSSVEKPFPDRDSNFHDYMELTAKLSSMAAENKDLVKVFSIGKSVEGREVWTLRISGSSAPAGSLPAIYFLGAHHAREHLSTGIPLMLADHLVKAYNSNDEKVRALLANREVYITPLVNPDGKQYDIESGRYRSWRKNRKENSGGSRGVDLNRNYSFGWGGGGASTSQSSDTYRGTEAFSEPETQAVKRFVEHHENITTLLSFHTFSELILYPWGHIYESIPNERDLAVHKTMAETMAQWNGYTPQQSSDLYIASGDTTDWSYGEHGIVSFTFELDPKSIFNGGFYPGQDVIPNVFRKNLQPCLYLIEYTDNPYRVLSSSLPGLTFLRSAGTSNSSSKLKL